ncbi:hypothetical protein I3842_06G052100 [Carya illinoinensis]|uniref:Uncharacterized protein n=1 Tax=Carya illinoinensis TaxID=32201 RepID=A0A922ESB5_CARIL|nr:hypothetical protein I3842_06G052100 [Carya illinoinensis]
MWKSVIVECVGEVWGGWCSNEFRGSHGVGLWKNIRNGWETFMRHTHIVVGDGSRVRFWHDKWCGERCLKDNFPAIFELARVKDAAIADLLAYSDGFSQWNVEFTRVAQDWELEVITEFYATLYSVRMTEGTMDRILWSPQRKVNSQLDHFTKFYQAQACPLSHGRASGRRKLLQK